VVSKCACNTPDNGTSYPGTETDDIGTGFEEQLDTVAEDDRIKHGRSGRNDRRSSPLHCIYRAPVAKVILQFGLLDKLDCIPDAAQIGGLRVSGLLVGSLQQSLDQAKINRFQRAPKGRAPIFVLNGNVLAQHFDLIDGALKGSEGKILIAKSVMQPPLAPFENDQQIACRAGCQRAGVGDRLLRDPQGFFPAPVVFVKLREGVERLDAQPIVGAVRRQLPRLVETAVCKAQGGRAERLRLIAEVQEKPRAAARVGVTVDLFKKIRQPLQPLVLGRETREIKPGADANLGIFTGEVQRFQIVLLCVLLALADQSQVTQVDRVTRAIGAGEKGISVTQQSRSLIEAPSLKQRRPQFPCRAHPLLVRTRRARGLSKRVDRQFQISLFAIVDSPG